MYYGYDYQSQLAQSLKCNNNNNMAYFPKRQITNFRKEKKIEKF